MWSLSLLGLSVLTSVISQLIESLPNKDYLVHSHLYLIRISQIDDREIFKICLEYWTKLVAELYEEMQQLPISDLNPLLSGGAPHPTLLNNYPLRKHHYSEVLSNLRQVMIEKMVKPEEVNSSSPFFFVSFPFLAHISKEREGK